jgi:hypothetical protein
MLMNESKGKIMNLKKHCWKRCGAALVMSAGITLGTGMTMAQTAPSAASEDGVEVLTRGPIHEAFAEAVVFDPQPGIIVPQAPPELIEEIQPDQRPAGDNVVWIPGYWAWDEEKNDFLWISGVWRKLPPNREWVPGYWSKVDTGHQWTSGYWQDAQTPEVTYLPEPPRSVESGPNTAATSDEQTWIPGTWQYRDDRYAWRAGYWVDARENWCWIPSYYRWTPYGYVYVDGYWDYPVVNRGVVFAPVRFRSGYYDRPGFYYSPMTVVLWSVFTHHLFVRPNYCHYYFGDYYDNGYRNRYYASYDYGWRNRGYDPIFAYNRWEHRSDRNWYRDRQRDYDYRRDNAFARPPRTWEALNQLPLQDRTRVESGLADRYDRLVENRKEGGQRFQKVSVSEREQFASKSKEIRSFSRERMQRETSGDRTMALTTGRKEAARVKVNQSPVAAPREIRTEKNGGPPTRVERKFSEIDRTASIGRAKDPTSKTGRDTADVETGKIKPTDRRDVNATAGTADRPKGETRTLPGQRREPAASAERKQQPSAEANGGREMPPAVKSNDRTKTNRVDESSTASKGKVETGKNATVPAPRKLETPEAKPQLTKKTPSVGETVAPPTRQTEPQRVETPQRQTTSKREDSPRLQVTPKREATPQRVEAPKPVEAPQRQATPKREATPQRVEAPERVEAPQRQATPKREATPQLQLAPKREATPQRVESPQRQAAPKREAPPQVQMAPKRQITSQPQMAPKREATPQRQMAPQREMAPQRQVVPQQRQIAPQQRQLAPQKQEATSKDELEERMKGMKKR